VNGRRVRLGPAPPAPLRADFERLRTSLKLPAGFPGEVEVAAAEAAAQPIRPDGRVDMRGLPFFTVDPPGSLDLDQAMLLERRGDGYRVRYAIADVAVFVPLDGPVETEAWQRGQTLYLPDGRIPLYPESLGEGATSLLAGQDRPAVVFTIDVDREGVATGCHIVRALVCSHTRLDYAGLDGDQADLLERIGLARTALAERTGAIQLDSPGQQVVADPDAPCGYRLELEQRLPSEDWNAQISLLAGAEAARIMLTHGCGLLRTMPPPDAYRLAALRRSASALGVPWPEHRSFAEFARGLHPADPREAVLIDEARAASGRAGYTAFTDGAPAEPGHAGVGSPYAHTTAPLRRLADRDVLDLLVELSAGRRPSPARLERLTGLPETMERAEERAARVERAVVDLVEARLLEHRVGQLFPATAVEQDARGTRIQIADPPVRARLHGDHPPPLGQPITVRLAGVDPAASALRFELV
jgi:exoribonuclease R